MSTEKKSTLKWWLAFLVSLAGTIAFLIFLPEWFWVMLPFLFTSLVYAFDWI